MFRSLRMATINAAFTIALPPLLALYAHSALAETSQRSVSVETTSIARSLTGKLAIVGTTFYRLSHVYSADDYLHAEGDPLFEAMYSGYPDGSDGDRLYYNVRIDPKAACGVPSASTTFETSDFLVFHQGRFVTLSEAFPEFPWRPRSRPLNRVSGDTLERLNRCAGQLAQLADAMPFRKISIYAGKQPITEVARTFTRSLGYEESPGEEAISKMTHLVVLPKTNVAVSDFDVQVRAVSVMHCDYEGPHLELDDWKQGLGLAITLKRNGNRFRIGSAVHTLKAPPFPPYTKKELRQAIARRTGGTGLASAEEAKPCAPFLRGYKFSIRYRSELVQEIFLAYAGGC